MKLAFTLLALLFASHLFANRIDELKTTTDVIKFIYSIDSTSKSHPLWYFFIKSDKALRKDMICDSVAYQWNIQGWEKADFNHDGLIDLVANLFWYQSYEVYTVIANKDGTFKLTMLSLDPFGKCEFAKVIHTPDTKLLFHGQQKVQDEREISKYNKVVRIDTLIYHYGGFIKKNDHPAKYIVKSVRFVTGSCEGDCPVFIMQFNSEGKATYQPWTSQRKPIIYKTKLPAKDLRLIVDLLGYINVKNLNNYYTRYILDDWSCSLTITFDDGSIKKIVDNGVNGTFGLYYLYTIFLNWRTTQHWTKTINR